MTASSTAPASPAGAVVSVGRRVFGVGLVLATLLLVFMGAQVKSHEAGLAVPDWPLSYGQLWPPMVGGTFHEHWHRTVATGVGLLAIVLALWTARTESRRWVAGLGWACLSAVVLQGLLGGLTVKGLLPTWVSMTHGTLAQMVLCLLAWLACAQSREWTRAEAATDARTATDAPAADAGELRPALVAASVALGAVFVQLVLGAWTRHAEAGLAVPFFPVSRAGDWLPTPVDGRVVIHMAHRGFALVAALLVARAALRAGRASPRFWNHGALLAGVLVLQLVLGALVIWTARHPVVTSLHVTNGAVVLLLTWLLCLRCWRLRRSAIATATGLPGHAEARSVPEPTSRPGSAVRAPAPSGVGPSSVTTHAARSTPSRLGARSGA